MLSIKVKIIATELQLKQFRLFEIGIIPGTIVEVFPTDTSGLYGLAPKETEHLFPDGIRTIPSSFFEICNDE